MRADTGPTSLLHENIELVMLARGMYFLLGTLDKITGSDDLLGTPRPLVFGEDKSFRDVARELGIEED